MPVAVGIIRETPAEFCLLPGEVSEAEKAQRGLPAPGTLRRLGGWYNHSQTCGVRALFPRGKKLGELKEYVYARAGVCVREREGELGQCG